MVGPRKNQDFQAIIEHLDMYFVKIKQNINNVVSSFKIIFVDKNQFMNNEKLRLLFDKIYRYSRYKCYKLREDIESGTIVIKKKTIALATLCTVGATSAFLFSFNGDLIEDDVNAQSKNSIKTTYDTSNLEFPNLSVNGQRFATDASIVAEKLNNYDFYNNGEKVVYLTFDDGPTKYTRDILDVLKKYNVRGTFFTTGTALKNGGDKAGDILKESFVYGNSIGNHTYSHDYKKLYPNGSLNLKAFNDDLDENMSLLRKYLGEDFDTDIIRIPGGSNSWNNMEPLKNQLDASGSSFIDWNALTGDSSSIKDKPIEMIKEAIETSKDKNLVVLLMHETNKYTPDYLDDIIRYYHSNGYVFKTLS